ncbi:hypothetical protein YB2330_003945 [Saitoella coloradoensis]
MDPPKNLKKRSMNDDAEALHTESSKHQKLGAGAELDTPSEAERLREKRDDDVIGEVERMLTCSICYEIMHNPIILLNCLHTFCGACFHTHTKLTPTPDDPDPGNADGGSKKMTCPTCRTTTSAKTLKKAWMLEGVTKSFLASYPHKKRPETELEELDGIWPGVKTPGTNTGTGAVGVPGPAGVENESDDDDNPDNSDDDDLDPAANSPTSTSDPDSYFSHIWLPCPSCPTHPYHPSSSSNPSSTHQDRRPVAYTCPAPIDRNLRIEMEANPEVEGHGVCVRCERVVPLHGRDPVVEAAAVAVAAEVEDDDDQGEDDDDMEIITEKDNTMENLSSSSSSEEYHTATSTPASPHIHTSLTSWYTHAERCKACGDVYCDAYYNVTDPSRASLLPLAQSVPPTQSLSSFVNLASGFGNPVERELCLEFVMGEVPVDSVEGLWRRVLKLAMDDHRPSRQRGMRVTYFGHNLGERDWVCQACVGDMLLSWLSRWWAYQIRKWGSRVKEEVRRRGVCEGGVRCERQGDVGHCREFEHLRG